MSAEEDRTFGRVPVWCPVCSTVMKGNNESYFRWGCCKLCEIQFVEDREQRWKDGWRPSAEEVDAFVSTMGGFYPKS